MLRAIAVLGVIFSHFNQHISESIITKSILPIGGLSGVELFFVLSGFLIGGIIIKAVTSGKMHSFKDVISFYKRRWLRTLPNYYLFLLVYLYFQTNVGSAHFLSFLTFTQNLFWDIPLGFYGVTWSLTIEEIFYLIFPLLIIAFTKILRKAELVIWASILIFLIVPFIIRLYITDPDITTSAFRKISIIRLDSIGYGVLFAAILHFKPKFWTFLSNQGFLLILPFWYFFIFNKLPHIGTAEFKTYYFPLISFTVGLTLPFFYKIKNHQGILSKSISGLSTISYSLYLCHIISIIVLNNIGVKEYLSGYLLFLSYFTASILFAYFIWNFWEKPWMDLRNNKVSLKEWFSIKSIF